jgi:ferredoxin
MSLRYLKTVRVVVALAVFVPATFLFLDVSGILPLWLVKALPAVQLVPSLFHLLEVFGWGGAGCIVVMLLTLAFGRVYCSTLCPLGTYQDVISRLNRSRNSLRRFRFHRQHYLLHYGLLFLATALGIGGSLLLLNLLEPFANFGRSTHALVRPLVVLMNNGIAWILEKFQVYQVYPVPFHLPSIVAFLVPLAFIATVSVMAFRSGRLYCNTLCPAGALLGLLSRVSLLRIVFDTKACKDCGLCEKVCKAQCIDSGTMRVDFSACVGCFNCFDACPTEGLHFGRRQQYEPPPQMTDRRRRKLLRDVVGTAAIVAFLPGDTTRTAVAVATGKTRASVPATPPGSQGIAHFTSACTACHLCVGVCPTQVLSPSFMEYGLGGIFQPHMDYSLGPCNYDCTLCGQICPNGAILPLTVEQKHVVQMGRAKFVRDDCIVTVKKTDCGACSEHCPTKAVHMVPYERGLVIPEVNEDICIGCGACEHPCPVTPRKAIYVEGNAVHRTAKLPEQQKPAPKVNVDADFPF